MTSIRVLHLEDNGRDVELIDRALHRAEFEAHTTVVRYRAEFESTLISSEFDLILCDYNLPDYDALTAIGFVQAHRPHLPVIVVSGELGDERAVECIRSGAIDYVLKQSLPRLGPVVLRALRETKQARERIEADAALRRFADLFESAVDSLVMTDSAGRIQIVNAQAERLFGRQRADMVGHSIDRLIPELMDRQVHGKTSHLRTETQGDSAADPWELNAARADGSSIPVDVRISVTKTEAGTSLVVATRDARERRAREHEARIARTNLLAGIEAQAAYFERGDVGIALGILLKCATELTRSSYGFVGLLESGDRLNIVARYGLSDTIPPPPITFKLPADAEGVADADLGLDAAFSRVVSSRLPLTLRRDVTAAWGVEKRLGAIAVESIFVAPIATGGQPTALIVLANFPEDETAFLQTHPGSLLHQAASIVERYLGRLREDALRAERAAAEAAAQQAFKILDATKDSVVIIDPDTLAFTYVNGGTLKLLGYTRDEIMSLSPLAIFPSDQVKRFANLIGPMARQGDSQVVRFTAPYRTNSGGRVPMEVSLQYVKPESGPPAVIAIGRDMTDWQRTLAELRNTAQKLTRANELVERARDELAHRVEERTAELATTERLLRDTTNGLPGAAFQAEWTDDDTLHFNFISAGFEGFTGVPRSTILADSSALFESIIEEDRVHFMTALLESREAGRDCLVEFRMRRPDGATIWTSSRSSPTEADGRTLWNGYWSDITAEKAAKLDLEQARRSAMAASEAKSTFLATMSHEIRTPMNAVVGLIDLLMRDSLTGEHRRMISTMRSSTFALLHIIDDILDFSKIEAGRLDTETKPTSIVECLELVADMFALKAAEKNLELKLVIEPRLYAPVLIDGTRVRQILINLVGNAMKFTESTSTRKGCVTIRGRLIDATADTDSPRLALEVQDNGIGLAPEQLHAVFEPFMQAESSTTRRFGGTGLGLTISRRLAELMGGNVSVISEHHQGSTFTLNLPALPAEADEELPLNGYGIVLIGPDIEADNYYAAWLRRWGSTVSTIDLTQADPNRIAQTNPGVLVLDATIPDALTQLGADSVAQLSAAAPLIVVSDSPLPESGASETRAVVVRANPFFPTALLGSVLSAVGRIETASAPQRPAIASRVPPSREEAERTGALVLVAEDNPANQEVIGRQLELLGYVVDIADDGLEALALWRANRYGLLLTDIHMPRCDGYDLATAIRHEQKVHMPIIALTADAVRGTLDRARAAGIDDYVTKPVELKTLAEKLAQWLPLDTSTARTEAEAAAPIGVDSDGINFAELNRFVGDDPTVHAKILQSFLRHAPASFDAMDQAFSGIDAPAMRSASHKLKSSARSIGALKLGNACESLEHAADDDDWATVERLFPTMRPLFNVLETRIGDHLRRH